MTSRENYDIIIPEDENKGEIKMNKIREDYINRMIAIYGFEHPCVVQFRSICEDWADNDWNNTVLRLLVEAHEADPCHDFDKED